VRRLCSLSIEARLAFGDPAVGKLRWDFLVSCHQSDVGKRKVA
jgi:hypothetical protein